MLLGAKRHNFTEANLKTGLESTGERQKQKQTLQPYCNSEKKRNFLWTKLIAVLQYKSTQLQLFLFDR